MSNQLPWLAEPKADTWEQFSRELAAHTTLSRDVAAALVDECFHAGYSLAEARALADAGISRRIVGDAEARRMFGMR